MPASRPANSLAVIGLSIVSLLLLGGARSVAAGAGEPPAATAAACANADLVPAAANLARIDAALLCLVNQRRAAAGLVRLRANRQLAGAALRHSRDMARTVTFSHLGPSGDTATGRVIASGYTRGRRSFVTSENLAWEPTEQSTPAAVVAAWMASAVHRGNILNARFRDTGIAAVLGPPSHFTQNGGPGVPITQVFGARR